MGRAFYTTAYLPTPEPAVHALSPSDAGTHTNSDGIDMPKRWADAQFDPDSDAFFDSEDAVYEAFLTPEQALQYAQDQAAQAVRDARASARAAAAWRHGDTRNGNPNVNRAAGASVESLPELGSMTPLSDSASSESASEANSPRMEPARLPSIAARTVVESTWPTMIPRDIHSLPGAFPDYGYALMPTPPAPTIPGWEPSDIHAAALNNSFQNVNPMSQSLVQSAYVDAATGNNLDVVLIPAPIESSNQPRTPPGPGYGYEHHRTVPALSSGLIPGAAPTTTSATLERSFAPSSQTLAALAPAALATPTTPANRAAAPATPRTTTTPASAYTYVSPSPAPSVTPHIYRWGHGAVVMPESPSPRDAYARGPFTNAGARLSRTHVAPAIMATVPNVLG